MLSSDQSLTAQRVLLDIQVTARFALKNISEPLITSNVVDDLYEQVQKLHLILFNQKSENIPPKSRG